jgi:subtilisin family serine protease
MREAAGERIPNQYIVVLKNTAVSPESVLPKAVEARNQGAEVHHVYQNAIRGYAVRVPNQNVLDSILSNPAVDYAQPDLIFRTTTQDLPTGVNRVDGDLSSTKSGDGVGTVDVDIAVLDTGIDLDHPDLNVYREKTFVSGTTTANDDDNHGTRVSGLAAAIDDGKGVVGMAPGARLWAIKVLDSTGSGTDSDIIAGIDYVTANAAEIDTVNLSFGGEGPDSALHTAIANSVAAGVTYVASAGNDNRDAASQVPASFPEVIAVSAIVDTDGKCGQLGSSTTVGDDDTLADFSNFGSVVDIAAPGVILKTTDLGGSYTTGNHFSGTSASAPVVTGAAALYKSTHPGASPSQIRDALRNSGSTLSTVCDGKGHGYFTGDGDSSPEPLLYMASDSSPVDDTPPTVTSTVPTTGATGVAVTSTVTGTFSEAVQTSTISTSTFTLNTATTPITSIQGTVTLSGNTATFDPISNLAAGTQYTAKLSGVKDIAGNQMADKTWSFTTATATPPPPPPSCGNNLPINTATSTPTQNGFPANNAIDNNANSKWWSTFSVKPWIKVDLGSPPKTICSVDIAWVDGNQRQYSFTISVSTDDNSYTTVFSGKSSGTSTSAQKYSFAETSARYVKITIIESHAGSSNSIAQISELDAFEKTGTSGINASSRSERNHDSSSITTSIETNPNNTQGRSSTLTEEDKGGTRDRSEAGAEINSAKEATKHDLPPVAKDDIAVTKINTAVVAKVLQNDRDRDGDELKVISVSDSKYGASVIINRNGTITFLPPPDYVGRDSFTYTIADGEGKSDKGKVTINVMPDRTGAIIEEDKVTAKAQVDNIDGEERAMRNQGGTDSNEVEVQNLPMERQ